jgi:hypothetical protein
MIAMALMRLSSGLTLSPRDDYSEFTSSSKVSLCPITYDDLSPLSKRAFARRKVIEEIIGTEESFISAMKMLSGIYLATLIDKGNNGIPLRLIHDYVDILIISHEEFLDELRNLYSISFRNYIRPFDSPDFDSRAQQLLSCSSPMMAALVAELINKKAISVYIYQEYNSIHDLVLKLMDSKEDDPDIGKTLTRSYQTFLEASQDGIDRMDLSFVSLISKPIARIPKYKLFLESLSKLTPLDEDEDCHRLIQDSIVQVDYSIKEVNRYGLQEKTKAQLLFENLSFPPNLLKFPVEYLGLPLLIGALHITWIGRDRQILNHLFGSFLFKTHIILATITKGNKYEVKFLIPLAVSRAVDSNDFNGGIYSSYENSFKLAFENDYKLFELLVICHDEFETSIWREKLEILTNVVNGPYKFDYSSSKFNEEQGTSSSTIIPPSIQSCDAKLDKMASTFRRYLHHDTVFSNCYFRELIFLKVEDDHTVRFKSENIVVIREVERCKIESQLEDLWSDELISNGLLDRRKKSTRRHRFKSTDNSGSLRVSLMRKTSMLGDALKSMKW